MRRYSILIVLLSLLFGCKQDNNVQDPTSEQADTNVFIVCFNAIDSVIGKSNVSAEQILESDGWVKTNNAYEKEISGVNALLEVAALGDIIKTTSVVLTSESTQTDLQIFSMFEGLVVRMGYSHILPTGKTCFFNSCETDDGNIDDYQIFCDSLKTIFDQETFSAIWTSNDQLSNIAIEKRGKCEFLFSIVSQ